LFSTKLLFSQRAVKLQGWTLALSDDHGLRKLENRVPKKIFGPKSDVVTGSWRRLPNGKGKGTVHPVTGHAGPEGEEMYSSTLSLTSALDGVGGQRHTPAALPPGKRVGTHFIGG
jgi:hypothetical protein